MVFVCVCVCVCVWCVRVCVCVCVFVGLEMGGSHLVFPHTNTHFVQLLNVFNDNFCIHSSCCPMIMVISEHFQLLCLILWQKNQYRCSQEHQFQCYCNFVGTHTSRMWLSHICILCVDLYTEHTCTDTFIPCTQHRLEYFILTAHYSIN